MEMTNKSTPILLLGVAGLGLSLAMFFDTKSARGGAEQVGPQEESEDLYHSESEPDKPYTEIIEVLQVGEEEEEEEKDETEDRTDYKKLYEKSVKKDAEGPRIIADHRYKGDGSRFDKRLYFMNEAYRRSRDQVPIDQNIALAVKLASALHEVSDESETEQEEPQE